MGIDKGILSALTDHQDKVRGPHFIMSAENCAHPESNEVNMSHDQILNHLFHAGYDAHEIKSRYGKNARSIIVYTLTPEQAEELHRLAARLGQNHSIYSNGQAHEMRFHHGAYAGRSAYGNEVSYSEMAPADNYHSLPGGMEHFDHQFDKSSLHLSGQLHVRSNRE